MPTITVPTPDYTDFDTLKKSKEFKRLADELLTLDEQADYIKDRQSELRQLIYPYLKRLGDTKSVMFGGRRLQRDDGGKVKGRLSAAMLIDEGVSVKVIEKCYEESSRKPTVKVVKVKGEEE